MTEIQNWLLKNKFKAHLAAFLLMILLPVLLYFAAQAGLLLLIWALVGFVAAANVLVLFVR